MAKRGLPLYFGGVVLVAVAAYGTFHITQGRESALAAARDAKATVAEKGARVEVITVSAGPQQRDISLLGDVRPFQSTTLYGKVSGYLKSVTVDRGDKVQAGQVLAEIDSTETDMQYASASADLENKREKANRSRELVQKGHISPQAAGQVETDLRMAEANVKQLGTLKSYEIIRAPFAGTVTARFADPGALIQNAATNQASSLPVVTISDGSRVRIAAYVEQRDAPFAKIGMEADISDSSNPDRKVKATLSRTSGSLDPRTRTLYVEFDYDNSAGFFVPGSFVQIVLHVPIQSYPRIPTNSLVMRGQDAFVAGIENEVVKLRPVRVASTDGRAIDISEGLKVGDVIGVNLPDDLVDGGKVTTVPARRR